MGEDAVAAGGCMPPRALMGARPEIIQSTASQVFRHLSGAARALLMSDDDACPLRRELQRGALREATEALRRNSPHYSAAEVITPAQRLVLVGALVCAGVITFLRPEIGGLLLVGLVAAGYLANAAFRTWLFWVGATDQRQPPPRSPPDLHDLPIYTVLVPLYREANVLPHLAQAMWKLDYPREKLDLKLVVEEDDVETVRAAHAAAAGGRFEVVVVPCGKPRTKPRACNYALQFARGDFLVVFDAEDRPEPHQLKEAIAEFRRLPREVACLQARLNFFNARECWITSGIMAQTPLEALAA